MKGHWNTVSDEFEDKVIETQSRTPTVTLPTKGADTNNT